MLYAELQLFEFTLGPTKAFTQDTEFERPKIVPVKNIISFVVRSRTYNFQYHKRLLKSFMKNKN